MRTDERPAGLSLTMVAIFCLSVLASGVVGLLVGRATAPSASPAPGRLESREVREQLDAIRARLAEITTKPSPLPSPPSQPLAESDRPPVDLAPLIERLDEIRALMIPENLDQIPNDVRVPKQIVEVDRIDALLAQKDYRGALAMIFGLSRSQLYRRLGQPDHAIATPDGSIVWYYSTSRNLDRKKLTIVFTDGMVSAIQEW